MRSDFSGKNQSDDGRCQFHDNRFPGGESHGIDGNPRGIHIDLELYRDGCTDENGYQRDDRNGIEAKLMDFFYDLLPEELAFARRAEYLGHQEKITTYRAYHSSCKVGCKCSKFPFNPINRTSMFFFVFITFASL